MEKAKVKICGVTTREDTQLAVQLGADLVGVNFYPPSPRFIDPQDAAGILADLPDHVVRVGVMVNESQSQIEAMLAQCPLDYVQLHGDESPAFCQALRDDGMKVIKALRIRDKRDLSRMEDFDVELILLDAFHQDLYGGSGVAFDWSMLAQEVAQRVLLAGGITPENVAEALELSPWGIDLCSGVEAGKGRKDPVKLKALFEAVERFYE